MLERDHGSAFGVERRPTCERMEQRRSQRIHVGAEILRFLVELLRSHIVGRAPNLTAHALLLLHEYSQTEVHDLGSLGVREENVPRLYITVDQTVLPCGPQAGGDLNADL